jgi:hypothetical protein
MADPGKRCAPSISGCVGIGEEQQRRQRGFRRAACRPVCANRATDQKFAEMTVSALTDVLDRSPAAKALRTGADVTLVVAPSNDLGEG